MPSVRLLYIYIYGKAKQLASIAPQSTMDASFKAQIILLPLIALVFFYHLFKKTQTSASDKLNKRNNGLHEPLGAWPLIGHLHLLRGQTPIARILGAMADEHGPVISLRLGLHRLVIISNWELVKECFTIHDKNLASRPNIATGMHIGYENAAFALAPYGAYWRKIRKIAILGLLSSHQVKLLNHVRVSEINSFIRDLGLRLAKNNYNPIQVPIAKLIEYLTFNNIIRVIAGKRYSAREYNESNSQAWKFEKAIKQATNLSGVFVCSDFFPCIEWMDIGGYVKSMKKTAKQIDDVLQTWLEEHINKRSNCGYSNENSGFSEDLMDKMLSTLDDNTIMSGYSRDTIIKATSMILILTGSESTSITLIWALSLLLNNPGALQKAQQEIDIHVGRHRWVQASDIKNLNYLQAIIKETLRLYPPAALTGPRQAMEDCHVAGFCIPKHTRFLVNIWKLHRDPRVWSEPLEFRPERFLTRNADVDVQDEQKFGYIPFSYGRRSCPGMAFGLHTVQLVLACLIQGFDIKTVGGMEVDMREGLGLAFPKLTPLEVVLTPRLSLELYENI